LQTDAETDLTRVINENNELMNNAIFGNKVMVKNRFDTDMRLMKLQKSSGMAQKVWKPDKYRLSKHIRQYFNEAT